jgi:hypothetical protein
VTAKNDPSLFTVHSNIPKIPNIRTPFLQHMKHLIATFENHLLQYPKNPLATREKTTKKHTNNKEDGFKVQAAPARGPITFELAGGTPE